MSNIEKYHMRTFVRFCCLLLAVTLKTPSIFAQNCSGTSVGFAPLNDLAAGFYQGYQGGLYPGGSNQRPSVHDSAGVAFAAQVKPLTSTGVLDTLNGRIVLLSIGMSNTTQEYSVFKTIADTDAAKNPLVIIVDGAQGGQPAETISDSNANYWQVIDQRLASAGVTRQQVQVAWVKEANREPTQAFPRHAQNLDSEFVLIARILKARYPNMRITYRSSRIYAGYATSTLNPEPYAYESAFAVKWTIERQINGDTLLTYSGSSPSTSWLAWGPYLWADGLVPRSDGLVWLCSDFSPDGTHPSTSGRLKVAQMLLGFFKTDPTAARWFLSPAVTSKSDDAKPYAMGYALRQNNPNPFNPRTEIRFEVGRPGFVTLKLFDLLGREVAVLVNEDLNTGDYRATWDAAGFSSGVYFYRLQARPNDGQRLDLSSGQAAEFVETKKLMLLK